MRRLGAPVHARRDLHFAAPAGPRAQVISGACAVPNKPGREAIVHLCSPVRAGWKYLAVGIGKLKSHGAIDHVAAAFHVSVHVDGVGEARQPLVDGPVAHWTSS